MLSSCYRVLVVIAIAMAPVFAYSQVVNDYRSTGDGDWTALGTWQRYNGTTWVAAAQYPGQGVANTVTIQEEDDVILNTTGTITIGGLVMEGNSNLNGDNTSLTTLGNPSLTITGNLQVLNGSLGALNDLTFNGTGNLSVGGSVTVDGGIFSGCTVQYGGSGTFAITGGVTLGNNGGAFTQSGGTLTVGGAVSIASTADMLISTGGNATFNGTVANAGTLIDSNNAATTIFANSLTNTGTFTSTAVTTAGRMVFRGGIANGGTFNAGSGLFNTAANQTIYGAGDISFSGAVEFNTSNVTNSNSGDFSVGGVTSITTNGDYTDTNNAGLSTFVGNVSVASGTTFTSTAVTTPANMVFRGGIFNDGTFSAGAATFNTTATQNITGNNAISFGGNVIIATSDVTMVNTAVLTISGTTTLTTGGAFIDNNENSTTTFVGLVTVNNGTTFTTTGIINNPARLEFRGGITNNGTFNAGAAYFNGDQTVAGNSNMNFSARVNVDNQTDVTNNNTAGVTMSSTVADVLYGNGQAAWIQGANSILNYAGTRIATALTASATGNTVNYNGAVNQEIFNATSSTYYNLSLSSSNTKTLQNNTIVSNDLLIQNTAIFSVSNRSLSVGGDWTSTSSNADPFVQGTQTVTLNGTATQNVTWSNDAQGGEFYNLVINNTAATPAITLGNAVIVDNQLTMTDGVVNLNGSTLTIGTAAASAGSLVHAGAAANGWFYGGTLRRYVPTGAIAAGGLAGYFPVGSTNDYRPFSFSGTVLTGGLVTVVHNDATTTPNVNFADGASTVQKRHDANWVVTNGTTPTGTYAIRVQGTGFGTIGDVTDLRIVHVNDATGMGTAGTNGGTTANPTVNRTGLTGPQLASTFYIGSVNPTRTPLPVELAYFVADVNNDQVDLRWRTASELNNDFFTVERAIDPEHFEELSRVEGSGTTLQPVDYKAIDPTPAFGRSYYRLKQTDFDGKFSYSEIVSVDYEGPKFATLRAYPNPSQGQSVTLLITGLRDQKTVPIEIIDAKGQVVYQRVFDVETPGSLRHEIELSEGLVQGMYVIRAGSTIQLTQKLLVN